jgi:hypothetical protein
MAFRRGAQIDRLQAEGNRDHDRTNHRKRPKDVDIGEKIDLMLERLAYPRDGLRGRFGGVGPPGLKKPRHCLDRLLNAADAASPRSG